MVNSANTDRPLDIDIIKSIAFFSIFETILYGVDILKTEEHC